MQTNPDTLYTLVKLRHAEQLCKSDECWQLAASTSLGERPRRRIFWQQPWSRLRHFLRRDSLGTAGR